jgi:TetR/AcrR family acrAB operon transcriptional repressor
MMRRTKEEAAATRKQVLEAALQVFSQKGYAATTLDDIAHEAGVTRGAIYWHFSNKADLYNTLVGEVSSRVIPFIEVVIGESGTVLEMLRRMFVGVLAYLEEDDEFRAVQELVLFKTAVTPEMEEGMRKKVAATRSMLDRLTFAIKEGIQKGEIRTDLNPRDSALAMMSFQNGLTMAGLLDPTLFSIKQKAEVMADIFVEGIRAGK